MSNWCPVLVRRNSWVKTSQVWFFFPIRSVLQFCIFGRIIVAAFRELFKAFMVICCISSLRSAHQRELSSQSAQWTGRVQSFSAHGFFICNSCRSALPVTLMAARIQLIPGNREHRFIFSLGWRCLQQLGLPFLSSCVLPWALRYLNTECTDHHLCLTSEIPKEMMCHCPAQIKYFWGATEKKPVANDGSEKPTQIYVLPKLCFLASCVSFL